ncbi:unnamed protein product [Cuscuta europaea]|uniref:Large ribosomal subunit protein bL28m n=1 Tax=Cuscuta europaea TaxID=41803 RepID=A0A9P0ZQD5_CUSEU|nr:unnamed protein product [Cuscuta europaea]
MAIRSKDAMKMLVKKLGGEKSLGAGTKQQLEKLPPKSNVIMGRAHRGLYAGRHIRFGNQVSEDGGNKTRRNWKPNVQGKRLFSYILDRFIKVKVSTHALRCIDRAGGFDEYLLKTPYEKMDSEFGVYWKAKIQNMYEELGEKEVFLSLEDEGKIKEKFKGLKLVEKAHCRQARVKMYDWILRSEKIEDEEAHEGTDEEAGNSVEEALVSQPEFSTQMVANA